MAGALQLFPPCQEPVWVGAGSGLWPEPPEWSLVCRSCSGQFIEPRADKWVLPHGN